MHEGRAPGRRPALSRRNGEAVPVSSDVEGQPLTSKSGTRLGTVTRVLYHPTEPRAIGLMVRPSATLLVIERRETYLPLSAVGFVEGRGTRLRGDAKKLSRPAKAAGELGYDPDQTVIWTHMNVRSPSERQVGFVHSVEFGAKSGEVKRLVVAGGPMADAAHGRILVDGSLVSGYRAGAIEVLAEAHQLPTTGGAARVAAKGAVVVSDTAGKVGAVVEDGMVSASGATGKVIRKVADSKVVERAAKSAGGAVGRTWRNTIDGFREGMK